jgi:hypothetical protein
MSSVLEITFCVITVNHCNTMKGMIHIFLILNNFPLIFPVGLCCYWLKKLNIYLKEFFLLSLNLDTFSNKNYLLGLPKLSDNNLGNELGSQFKMEDSWIYSYLCNQCISPLKLWVRTPFMTMCTRYNIMR